MISAATHIARLVARRLRVRARRRVRRRRSARWCRRPAQLALRLARLIERPGAKSGPRLSRALTRLGPAYLKLGQFLATRPDVVGVAMARDLESLQDRLPPFSQSRSRSRGRGVAGTPCGAGLCELRPAGRGSVDRAGASRRGRDRTASANRSPSRCCGPTSPRASAATSAIFSSSRNKAEAHSAEARRLRLIEIINTMSRSVAMEMDLRLEAAALSEMAENTRDDPDFRVPDRRLGSHHPQRADDGVDRRHRAERSCASRASACRSARSRPQGDPEFSAPRAARRLLPRRHASGQPVPRRCRPAGRGRFRHHGPARA